MSIAALGTSESRRKTFRPRRLAVWGLITLAVAAIVLDGAAHRPLPPAQGIQLHGDFAAFRPAARLRIASFNIHGCRDAAGRFDFQRTADALRGFDVIGLNEVHGAWDWQGADQAELLGRRLEMPWLFAPTTWRWWRDDFGNGLLCRASVAHWRRLPLNGTRNKGHRNMVVSDVSHGATTIHLIVTHLDRVQDRAMQLDQVAAAFLALPEPAVLMGDLNTQAEDPALARLLATPGVHDLVGEAMPHGPPPRIDWILGRGLHAIEGGVIDTGASDHPLVWAEVEASPETRD